MLVSPPPLSVQLFPEIFLRTLNGGHILSGVCRLSEPPTAPRVQLASLLSIFKTANEISLALVDEKRWRRAAQKAGLSHAQQWPLFYNMRREAPFARAPFPDHVLSLGTRRETGRIWLRAVCKQTWVPLIISPTGLRWSSSQAG